MAEEKKKRVRSFDRSYSDKDGKGTISRNEEEVQEVSVDEVHETSARALILRGVMGILVGVGTAALKAEGGTEESAAEAIEKAWNEIKDGTYSFRSAAGDSGLSIEDEQQVIAEYLVQAGKVGEVAAALELVKEVYARTVPTQKKQKDGSTKTYDRHADYNVLKKDEDIRKALAKAEGKESKVDSILFKKAA